MRNDDGSDDAILRRLLWSTELRKAKATGRKLEPTPAPDRRDLESCVMCERPTNLWLQPENAPLCCLRCLRNYLKDPRVYDPRELYRYQNLPN